MNWWKHETAIVDQGSVVGEGTKVWHFTHVCSGAIIGRCCTLGQNVFVASGAVIGDGVKIQNNVSVYDSVVLEDDVFCGPSMVFTNVRTPRAAISRKDEYLTTVVRRGATLGANCTVVCGVTIGEFALVGAGAVVTKSVSPFALVLGVPAEQVGWVSAAGERLPLPVAGNGQAACPRTGEIYELSEGGLRAAG
jgi:UDP-2-acetamido-3-amino-2,3-dideoxy-glucuronate N-acetyltransferase